MLTAGENVTIGQVCYMKSDGKLWKAKADDVSTMPGMYMALESISTDAAGRFLQSGVIREDNVFNFTVGAILYVDASTAGAITSTAPSGSGDQIQVIGYCFPSAHYVVFKPSGVLVQHI